MGSGSVGGGITFALLTPVECATVVHLASRFASFGWDTAPGGSLIILV